MQVLTTAPNSHRCGHVLCLVCALRYHSACDASGKACTCPLCLAPVLQGELLAFSLRRPWPLHASAHHGAPFHHR